MLGNRSLTDDIDNMLHLWGIEEKNNKGFLITDHLYKQVTGISDNIYFLSDGKTQLLQNIEEIETLGYVKN